MLEDKRNEQDAMGLTSYDKANMSTMDGYYRNQSYTAAIDLMIKHTGYLDNNANVKFSYNGQDVLAPRAYQNQQQRNAFAGIPKGRSDWVSRLIFPVPRFKPFKPT